MLTLDKLTQFYSSAQYGSAQYTRYMNALDRINGGQTARWIHDVIKGKGTIADAVASFDSFFNEYPGTLSDKTIQNYRSGYIKYTELALGYFSANTWLSRGRGQKNSIFLCQMVADSALFASSEVVEAVKNGELGTGDNHGNRYASWDYMLHIRAVGKKTGYKKGDTIEDVTYYPKLKVDYPDISDHVVADDNSYANRYIKTAVLESLTRKFGNWGLDYSNFANYEACHIWDFPSDRRYYASIANLVLIPRALAGLSDHNQQVKDMLRQAAKERFGFEPDGLIAPTVKFYGQIKWRDQ